MALQVDQATAAALDLDIFIHSALHLSAISCLYYDHFLTIDQEIDYVWTRARLKSSSTHCFLLNRYFAFFGNLAVTILGFSALSLQSCKHYLVFRQLFLIVNQILVSVLLTLRVYALYQCSQRVLMFLLGIGVILVIISAWALSSEFKVPAEATASGCHVGLPNATAFRLAGAWEALFVYDSLIFSLTIYKAWKVRQDYMVTGVDIPLISLILRDGAIYFSVMAICNFSNILTFYLCTPFLRGSLSSFANSMSVTLMSRLILNLHQTADAEFLTTQEVTSTNVDYNSYRESPSINVDIDTHEENSVGI